MAREKDGGVPQTSIRMEEAIYRLQEAQIRLLYGKQAASQANYGWAVDVGDNYYECSTKIYDPPMVITTRLETSLLNNY